MSEWADRVGNHPIWETLDAVDAYTADGSHGAESVDKVEAVDQLRQVSAYARELIDGSDPHLISPQTLDGLNGHLANAHTYVTSFLDHEDAGNRDEAINQLGYVLQAVSQLPQPAGPVHGLKIRKAATNYRRSVAGLVRSLESEADTVRSDLEQAASKLAQLQNDLEQGQSATTNSLERMAADVEAARQAATEQVEAATEAARSDVQERLSEVVDSANTEGQEHADRLRHVETDASERAEDVIVRLAEYREQAAGLVSIIGNTGLIGRFQEVANNEKKAADTWRRVAAALFAVGIAAGVVTLWLFGIEARVLIAFSFIAFGAFAEFESRTHRKREHLNRDLELQLSSLDAYLESLDKTQAQEIKSAIAPRFFVGRGKAPRFSGARGEIEHPDPPLPAESSKAE